VWFQEVIGDSATISGLQMLPLMFGLIVASMITGLLMTKTGRYKMFPIIGGFLITLGVFLIYTFSETSGQEHFIPILMIIGLGVGSSIQILTVVAQNVVSPRDIAVATTVVNFSRTIGASFGVAVFTSIFDNYTTNIGDDIVANPGRYLNLLDSADPTTAISSYVLTEAIKRTFVIQGAISCLIFIICLFIDEIPLRKTIGVKPAE